MAESHREEIAKLEALYAGNPGGRVFVHLAEAYRKAGEHERARRILDEGLARHTDSASGYVVLGRVLADMQIGEEAEVAFRRVLELDSGNLVALRWLGDLARQSGRLEEAVSHYRDLLSRNPSNEEVRDLVEIVEREASGGDRVAAEPEPEPEWHEAEPAAPLQEDDVGEDLTALSAAPGRTGDEAPADIAYGFVEIQTAEDVREEEPASPLESGDPGDPHVVESLAGEVDEAERELGSLARTDEAEPLEIHLLDPAFAGAEADDEADDYAGEEFIADLLSTAAGGQEPDALDANVDVLSAGSSLTLQADLPEGPPGAEPGEAEDSGFGGVPGGDSGAEPPPLTPHGDELALALQETSLVSDRKPEEQAGEETALPSGTDAEPTGAGSEVRMEPAATDDGARLLDRMDALAAEFAGPTAAGDTPGAESASVTERHTAELDTVGQPRTVPGEPASEAGPVTETLAELYRAQGFHERAAEVYRALLKQRPFDLRLSAKLSEAEADAAAAAAERAAAAAAVEPDEEPSGDVWLRGVGSPWGAETGTGESDATPYAWTPEPEDQPGGEPISAYLKDLVSWKTSRQGWANAPRMPREAPEPRSAAWSPDDEPWAATPAAEVGHEAGTRGQRESGIPETAAPAADGHAGAGVDAGTESSGEAEGISAADGALPDAADQAAAGAPDGEAAAADEADPWASAGAGEPQPAPAGWTAEAEPQSAPQQDTGSEAEDEDLEMFRSWLQSLKK